MGSRKPPRVPLSVVREPPAPVPPEAPALDPEHVRFIEGGVAATAPQGAAGRSTVPHGAAGRRGIQRWTDGTEARKHSAYLPAALSERFMAYCKQEGIKPSKGFELAVLTWLEVRDEGA